jgi:hypothetical protein
MHPNIPSDTKLPTVILDRVATEQDIINEMSRAKRGEVVIVASLRTPHGGLATVMDVVPAPLVRFFVEHLQRTIDMMSEGTSARVEIFESLLDHLEREIERDLGAPKMN